MLAIIIPYYKHNFFEETLKSLANQTNKNFKVYIGNDASNNNPEELLKEYKGSFDFEYQVFKTNLGSTSLAKQWARCIEMVKDEHWINILGDDDVLGENVVALFYKRLEEITRLNINIVRFASKIIDASGCDISHEYTHPKIELSTDAYFKKFNLESRSSLSEYIFLKSSYNKHGFVNYPLGWHSDDKAWLDFTNGGEIYTINDAVFYIRRSNLSISGKNDNLVLKSKARRLFFKDILSERKFKFKKVHKRDFLFEYGNLIKEQELITFANIGFVLIQFIRLGLVYDAGRFLRRMYRAKFSAK